MADIQTRHLMSLKLQVDAMQTIGAAPGGDRRVGLVAGGTFTGEKLNGTVLPGGADWIVSRPDGCMTLDVRLVLQTDDGALIDRVCDRNEGQRPYCERRKHQELEEGPGHVTSLFDKRACASLSHARASTWNDADVTPPAATPVCLGATSIQLLDTQTFER